MRSDTSRVSATCAERRVHAGASRCPAFASLALLLFCATTALAAARAERSNILLITLDTTRADRLGAYGYPRDTSSHLDRIAREATVYLHAYSTSSWTLPAHASLFTGKFPTSHGARYDPEGPLILSAAIDGPDALGEYRARGLAPDQTTLAEVLGRAGYDTAAVVAGPWLKRVFGLDRGFASYDDAEIDAVAGRRAAQVTDAAIRWLDETARPPFFLFLNFYDPHGPYLDPAGVVSLFLPRGSPLKPLPPNPTPRLLNAYYDAEIRYMDRHIGRLADHLRARKLYDSTWIIVTADHGELLGEHGKIGHGHSLYQEEIRIPLIVKHPAGESPPGTSERRIQLTDILPLILERLRLPLPPDVKPFAAARDAAPIFAEVYPRPSKSDEGDWRAFVSGDLKLLWNSDGDHRLYDLATDPGETEDLSETSADRAGRLTSKLDRFRAALPAAGAPAETRSLDAETRRALRELGYLE